MEVTETAVAVTAELFSICVEPGQYLIYAPAVRSAFVGNSSMVNLLADMLCGTAQARSGQDATLNRFFRRLDLIGPATAESESNPAPLSELGLTLVVTSDNHHESAGRILGDHESGSVVCKMGLRTAISAVRSAIERAVTTNVGRLAITYRGCEPETSAWNTMVQSLDYARTSAQAAGLDLVTAIELFDKVNEGQAAWVAKHADRATVRISDSRHRLKQTGAETFAEETVAAIEPTLTALDQAFIPYSLVISLPIQYPRAFSSVITHACLKHSPKKIVIDALCLGQTNWDSPPQEVRDLMNALLRVRSVCGSRSAEITTAGADFERRMRLCGTSDQEQTVLPDGTLADCCGSENPGNDLNAPGRQHCNECFARHHCLGGCEGNTVRVPGSIHCHIVREITSQILVSRISSAGGLSWHGTSVDFTPKSFPRVGQINGSVPSNRQPRFALRRIKDSSNVDPPGVFPVLVKPWLLQLSRRRFLGMCLGAGAAMLMEPPVANALMLNAQIPVVVRRRRVDPDLLSMVAIAAGPRETIEEGYHLRWFVDNLPFPDAAFPQIDKLKDFLESRNQQIHFDGGARPGSHTTAGTNPGIPWAFWIYRREHFEHYDHSIRVDDRQLNVLRKRGTITLSDVFFAFEMGPLASYLEDAPDSIKQGFSGNVTTNVEVLRITFREETGNRLRPIHYVDLTLESRSQGRPNPIGFRGLAGDKGDPARQTLLEWRPRERGWSATTRYTQGHYSVLELFGSRLSQFVLRFSYMDEDLLNAPDPERKKPSWELVAQIPFITAFQTWEAARDALFPHETVNRYIELEGVPGGEDWRKRLDFKYELLFPELQKSFLRIRLAELLGEQYLSESSDDLLHRVESDPNFMYQFWSLDPIVATLLGQKYTDIPVTRSPTGPRRGATYDYMISTAWGDDSQWIYYIAQNVSAATTPRVQPPRDYSAEQLEGRHRTGDTTLYRGVVRWLPPASAADESGAYEPSSFDVRRKESDGTYELLTHRVLDPLAADPEKRFLDSPVCRAVSPPDLKDVNIVQNLAPTLAAGFMLQQVLQQGNTFAEITAEQVAVCAEMTERPISEFYIVADPYVEFNQWLPLDTAIESRSLNYQIRSIDLFGRTSDWQGEPVLTLTHRADPTPEATRVEVRRQVSEAGQDWLRVEWSIGADEIWSDKAADHFHIMWKLKDADHADRRFLEVVYFDLLARVPSSTEMDTLLTRLSSRTATRHSLTAEIATSTEYATKNGSDDAAFVSALHRDLFRGTVYTSALEAAARGDLASGMSRQDLVLKMLASSDYQPGSSRRFVLWKDRMLVRDGVPAAISFNPPLPINVRQVVDLQGSSIYGRLLDGTGDMFARSGQRAIQEENAFLGGQSRLVTVTTDQSLMGIIPFVDISGRYGEGAALLDRLDLAVGTANYQVIGLEPGDPLKLGVKVDVPAANADPVAALKAQLGPDRNFSLTFTTVMSAIAWTQTLDINHFPEIGSDDELPIQGSYDTQYVSKLLDRPNIQLRVPGLVEITGREAWIAGQPWLVYTTGASETRVPVVDAERFSISSAALYFGRVLIGSGGEDAQELVINNSASTPLGIQQIVASPNDFVMDPSNLPAQLGAGGELRLTVRFKPTIAQNFTGILTVTLDRGAINIPLGGVGTSTAAEKENDVRSAVPRHFLAGLTLAPVLTDVPTGETSVSVFPPDVLLQALQGSVSVNVRLELPPIKHVTLEDYGTSDTSPAAQRLKNARQAELTFVEGVGDDAVRYLASVVCRPSGTGAGKLAFLLRSAPALPFAAKSPINGQRCIFYARYREEFALPEELASPDRATTDIEIAVSTHRSPARAVHDPDGLNFLVSIPVPVKLPANQPETKQTPTDPLVCDPTADPWPDPFVQIMAGTPKVLENRKVVQVALDLTSTLSSFPSIELYRATEDALRHTMFRTPKGDDADQYGNMTIQKRYEALARRLYCDWNDTHYSFKSAFFPIDKINGAQFQSYKDQIEGIAATNLFYAFRRIREGAVPGELELLTFRVTVPDLTPPPEPTIVKIAHADSQVTIEWRPVNDPSVKAYEIHHVPKSERIGPATLVATRYVDADEAAAEGGTMADHASLMLVPVQKQFVVLEGKLNLVFPLSAFGVAGLDSIVGFYRTTDGFPRQIEDPTYDFASDAKNLWPWLRPALTLENGERVISGFDPTRLPDRMGLPEGSGIRIVVRRDKTNETFEEKNEDITWKYEELILDFHAVNLEGLGAGRRTKITGIFVVGGDADVNLYPTPDRFAWESHELRILLSNQTPTITVARHVRVELSDPAEALDQGELFTTTVVASSSKTSELYKVRALRK